MGATKTEQYTSELIRIAKIADALGHPARLSIAKLLMDRNVIRPTDLSKLLKLHKTSVNSHLRKMRDAKLIDYSFRPTEYVILINDKTLKDFNHFIDA
ncbi:MAG: helix-turn-helix domain-containing protein [Bacteroidota bacterium]